MKLFHDSIKAAEIEDKLVRLFEETIEDRTEVHLSDTSKCPLRVYCRLVGMEPIPFTKQSIGFMSAGQIGQMLIQQLYPEELCEYEHPFIPSHIDVFEDEKYPIEIKISSQKVFRAADVPASWRKQLMGYISIHDAEHGWLLILNLFSRQWTAFKMIMTPKEREDYRGFLTFFRTAVTECVKERDPTPLFPFLEPDEIRAKECKYCDYRPDRRRKVEKRLDGPRCTMHTTGRKKKT